MKHQTSLHWLTNWIKVPKCSKDRSLILQNVEKQSKDNGCLPRTKRVGINTGPPHKASFYSAFLLVSCPNWAVDDQAFFFLLFSFRR